LAAAYYGYDFVHVTSFVMVDERGSKFEQSLEKAFSINPGVGTYLA
jgi:hypothetical protein